MINQLIDAILDRVFPRLARRDRLICRLFERKRNSRAFRDEATAEMRMGTTRLLKTLCRERANYIGEPGAPELVYESRVSHGA